MASTRDAVRAALAEYVGGKVRDTTFDATVRAVADAAEKNFEHDLLATAFDLLGDGAGYEWDQNPEYTRGVVELVRDLLGYRAEQNDEVEQIIREGKR